MLSFSLVLTILTKLQQVPGDSLDKVWPTLTSYQETKVCVRLVELLLKLFNYRGSRICTDLEGTGVNNRGAASLSSATTQQPQEQIYGYPPVLQSRPFTQGPLASMDPPQEALTSTTDYLVALSHRMDRIFTDPTAQVDPPSDLDSNEPLTDTDISRIRETWHRLGSLIPYHTGGFYIPGTLSSEARHIAYSVLQSREFGIYHSDMQMSRFIIQIIPKETGGGAREDPDPNILLTLTGWEHAFRAPLWSCARLPLFLTPRPIPNEPITWERQASLRNLIFYLMNDVRMQPLSWQWIIGYVFGVPERWFEGCLGSHWMYRDAIEVALGKLKRYWEGWRPDIPFPLEVGDRVLGSTVPRMGYEIEADMRVETGELFTESINALARASGTTAQDWELA